MVTNQSSVDRAEHRARAPRCRRCTRKSATRIDERDRHDVVLERGRRDVETLHRAEHRDGRRDDAVAVEQRRAEQPERDQQRAPAPLASAMLALQHEREQREDAALAAVVGAQDEDEVLDDDDEQ